MGPGEAKEGKGKAVFTIQVRRPRDILSDRVPALAHKVYRTAFIGRLATVRIGGRPHVTPL